MHTLQALYCLRVHIYSYMALYELAIEQFFKDNPDLKDVCLEATSEVEEACSEAIKSTKAESVKQANAHLLQKLTQENVTKRLHDWEEQKANNAMFRSMMNYLHRVETILYFVAASRNADLHLHLEAGETLSKLFFALDRIFFSPDTDVFVLIITSCDLLPKNTSISMVSGVLQIKPLWTALGPENVNFIARIPCILWGRQHWKVCTNRQVNLVQAVPTMTSSGACGCFVMTWM